MVEAMSDDAFAACARAIGAAFGDGVSITGTQRLCGDASNRTYVRLALGTHVPATAVAMLLGEGRFVGGDELGGGSSGDELPFVNVARYLARYELPVPQVYHDAARSDGLVLIEDIGDTNLWTVAETGGAEGLFGRAVDLLVRFQITGERAPDAACCAFRRRFDGVLAHAELEHFVDHGIETRHGRPLAAADRAAILDALAPVEAAFLDVPPVLSHRDFMAWNLHVQDERLRLIDFQDALLAPEAYDLAALLTDRHTPNLIDPACETRLIERFLAARRRAGFPVPAGFFERYRLCALHRALKVIGRFYFLEVVKGKPGYLAYLPGVYAVARRMFDLLPALVPARERIVAWVPELAPGAGV